ncbi:tripartite motif-containing protein 45-like [Gigantopelta aegis]|uniref:tripartite motif-containing protein 45-like n=1 Tax=Gigantopelta aegis TaxID=1735272 RepID=UPI001B88E727|nr:tripartite motif-containing protein 45-like [Gigantopelta aegis]
MASKQRKSLMTTIRDDFLTCKICFNIYEQPKILPCVHTYCTPCLEKLLKTSDKPGSISCPECRERVIVPHGSVSDLKTNIVVTALTGILKENPNTRARCTACSLRGNTSPANSRCLDCGDYLCPVCCDGHNASFTTWKHKKVPLEDMKGESKDQEHLNNHTPTCPKHSDKVLEYFCETCDKTVCVSCISSKHRSHECLTITAAVTIRKRSLINEADKIREKLRILKKREKNVLNKRKSILQTKTEIKRDINERITRQIAKLEQQRESVMKVVDDRAIIRERQVDSELNIIQNKMSLTGNCLEFFEALIERCDDEKILRLDDLVVSHLLLLDAFSSDGSNHYRTDTNIKRKCAVGRTKRTTPGVNNSSEKTTTQIDEEKSKVSLEHLRTLGTPDGTDCRYFIAKFYGEFKVKRIEMPHHTIVLTSKPHGRLIQISASGHATTDTASCFFPFRISRCGNIVNILVNNSLRVFKNTHGTHLLTEEDLPHAVSSFKNSGYVVGHQRSNELQVYDTNGQLQEAFPVSLSYPLANISVDTFGNITTCEWGNNSVRVLSLQNGAVTVCTEISSLKANAACVDENGLLYTVEKAENRVSVFDKSGSCLLQHNTTQDGLDSPLSLALDDEGLLYVVNEDDVINIYGVNCE